MSSIHNYTTWNMQMILNADETQYEHLNILVDGLRISLHFLARPRDMKANVGHCQLQWTLIIWRDWNWSQRKKKHNVTRARNQNARKCQIWKWFHNGTPLFLHKEILWILQSENFNQKEKIPHSKSKLKILDGKLRILPNNL